MKPKARFLQIDETDKSLVRQRASVVAQLVKNPPAMRKTPVQSLGREDPLRRDRLPTPVFLGFPGGSVGKESAWNVGDLSLIPGLGRPLEKGEATHSSILALENGGLKVGHD